MPLNKYKSIISRLSIPALILSILLSSVLSVGATTLDVPQTNFASAYQIGDEIVELRDQYSSTYLTQTGYRWEVSIESRHYQDNEGIWQEIETDIVPSDRPNWDWEVTTGHWQLFIRNDTTVGIKKDGNWVGTRLHGIAYLDITTKDYTILQTANDVTPIVSGNEIRWDNILYGVDFVLRYTNDSFKEDIIIRQEARDLLSSPGHRPSDYGYATKNTYLVPIFECDWSQSLSMKLDNGLPVNPDEAETEGIIHFKSTIEDPYWKTKLVSFLPVDYAVSANPTNPEDPEEDWIYALERLKKRLVKKNNKHWLLIGAPVVALNQMPEGSIIFDPTETLRPNATGDEENCHDQPSAGDNWADVDDVAPDEDSTYVYALQADGKLRDLYNLPASSGSGVINKITVYFRAYTAGTATGWAVVKSGGTTDEGAGQAITVGSYNNYTEDWATNPDDAGAWEWADIDDLQIGVAIQGDPGIRCTQVYVVVDYIGLPTVTTQAATNVEDTTATGNGNITDTGGENCDIRGIVWDLATHGAPGNVAPGASGYANNVPDNGDFGVGAFTRSLTGLPTGDTIYARAYAHNSAGYAYGGEINFLTKPAAPTNVAATDGAHTDKVVITWTKSTGATGYKIYEGINLLDTVGDVATFDDNTAPAPIITPGAANASDGTSPDHVTLSLAGESVANGANRTYKVVALNGTGDSDDSATNIGYRGHGALTYQWQRSSADADADYGNIGGATTDPYNDVGAPANGDGRFYRCVLDATGAAQQISTTNRGYRITFPTMDTTATTNVEETSATLNGDITATGGDNADFRGFVWDTATHGDPGDTAPGASDYASNWTEGGNFGIAAFNHGITSLTQGELYYYRACAHNAKGWAYGDEVTFLTKPEVPTGFTATSGGDGDSIDLAWTKGTGAQKTYIRGKEDAYPANRADGVLVYNDTGVSFSHIGLDEDDDWYYRAWSYATEGGKEQYSDAYAQDWAIASAWAEPTVTTNVFLGFGGTWAVLSGTIDDEGDAGVTQIGFDYGLSDAYGSEWTLAGSWTTDDTFVGVITGLTRATVFHYRAKAYNDEWGYGSDMMFATEGSPAIYEYLNTGGDGASGDIYGSNWGGQSFTVGATSHTITSIRVYIKRTGSPGTVTISLKHATGAGLPTGSDITSGTLDGDAISDAYTWYEITTIEIPLEAGEKYAIVIRAVAGDDANDIQWRADTGGGLANAIGCSSTDGGITWGSDAPADYLFEVWGNPCLDLVTGAVFRGYLEEGDMLFLFHYKNIYVPYYPYDDPSQYFNLQVLDTDGTTLLHQVPCQQWGYMPGSVYISADNAVGLTEDAGYYLRIYGTFSGNPSSQYQLTADDWMSTVETYLDQWVIHTAYAMEEYYGVDFTINVVDKGIVLNEVGGAVFIIGIPELGVVRPDLFQVVERSIAHTDFDFTDEFSAAITWQEMVGEDLEAVAGDAGTIFGLDDHTMIGIGLLIGYIGLAVFVFAQGHTSAGLALAFPFIIIAGALRVIDIAIIAIVAIVMVLLTAWSLWWTRT